MAAAMISGGSFVGMLLDLPRFFHRKDDAVIHTTPALPSSSCLGRNHEKQDRTSPPLLTCTQRGTFPVDRTGSRRLIVVPWPHCLSPLQGPLDTVSTSNLP